MSHPYIDIIEITPVKLDTYLQNTKSVFLKTDLILSAEKISSTKGHVSNGGIFKVP